MTVAEFKELFKLDNSEEFDAIINNNDMTLLRKKFREAVKQYHPDSGNGDAEKFIRLQEEYKNLLVVGITNIIGDKASDYCHYFDISETRKINDIIWNDIEGNKVDRRKIADNLMFIVATMQLELCDEEEVVQSEDRATFVNYRQDGKYCMEVSIFVEKEKYDSMKERSIRLTLYPENEEEYVTSINICNAVTKKGIKHKGIRLDVILNIRLT